MNQVVILEIFYLSQIFWASQTLPLGVSIDQAIKDGVWQKMLRYKK
jgi:hypothetical protein